MSCYSCGASFGTFKKEHGCKNCGFAFCTKCLPHKLEIPKLNNEKHRVCLKCYNIMTGKVKPKEEPVRYSPPENFKKRVAALQERESAGKSAPAHHGHAGGSKSKAARGSNVPYKGMSQADFEIQQRLEKLREKTPQEAAAANVSMGEIDDRLAKLKGMDPARYKSNTKPTYHPPDRRTKQEQMNDLLDEISNEVELDSKLPDPAEEISSRLAKLKQNPDSNTKASQDANENNLNKASLKDSQTFSQNIFDPTVKMPEESRVKATNNSGSSTGAQKGDNKEEEDQVHPEEVRRILNEAAHELEQDAQKALTDLQQDKEIMKRIQDIKERRKKSSGDVNRDDAVEYSDSENEEADDDVMAEDIIKQAMEESKLDEAASKEGIDISDKPKQNLKKKDYKRSNEKPFVENDDEWYDPDELPYCCICTEDAVVRCRGCDMDLYCNKCFSDGHKELGLTDHKTLKYKPLKGLL